MVAALAWVPARPARAGQSDDLLKQGIEERRKGHDREALELFKRAHDIDKGVRSMAQMGLAEQALGMWPEAEAHLRDALEHGDDPWIKKNVAALRKAAELVSSHLGSLEIWGTPAGAEIVVNGTAAGTLPLAQPLRVAAGTVSLTVRATGFVELERAVEVAAGGVARERFELPRKRAANLAAVPPRADGGDGAAPGPLVKAPTPRDDQPQDGQDGRDGSSSILTKWWFWTAVGAVVVAGGVTAYLVLRPGDCAAGQMCAEL